MTARCRQGRSARQTKQGAPTEGQVATQKPARAGRVARAARQIAQGQRRHMRGGGKSIAQDPSSGVTIPACTASPTATDVAVRSRPPGARAGVLLSRERSAPTHRVIAGLDRDMRGAATPVLEAIFARRHLMDAGSARPGAVAAGAFICLKRPRVRAPRKRNCRMRKRKIAWHDSPSSGRSYRARARAPARSASSRYTLCA